MKLIKKIKVAIDSPAAAGAGTISKMIAKHYNLLYCDTGKIYRFLAKKLMQKKTKNKIRIMASPWSPPAWMKTNDQMNFGGKIKDEHKKSWANYTQE